MSVDIRGLDFKVADFIGPLLAFLYFGEVVKNPIVERIKTDF